MRMNRRGLVVGAAGHLGEGDDQARDERSTVNRITRHKCSGLLSYVLCVVQVSSLITGVLLFDAV